MKRMILRVVAMLLAFGLGVAAHWLILRRVVNNTPKVEAVNSALLETAVAPAVPVVPAAAMPPLPLATPKPHFILDYDPEGFYPFGMYYLMDPKPAELESFDGFELDGPGHSETGFLSIYKLYPDGSSVTNSGVFVLLTKHRLVFATDKSDDTGIEYRFEGEFLRTDFDAVSGEDKAVLRGVLTRMKDGRTLVERKVTFKFVYVGC